MDWYNEPAKWTVKDDVVAVQAEAKTDFWRVTYSGVIEDSGHFYYQRQAGDFVTEVKVSGDYAVLYDQAGLMVRVDEAHWIKCGIEFIDGVQHASAVVTREYSDWSMVPLAHNPVSFWLRVKRLGSAIEIYYSLDGVHYQMLRQAYFSSQEALDVGLMCASPDGEGFSVRFEGLSIRSA